jgi:hypothetical protein
MDKSKEHNRLACGFSLTEQVYAQVTFHGFWLSGFLGITLQDWKWAVLYSAIVVYGILGIVQRHLTCPRCPHLHEHDACLQLHPRVTRLLIRKRKNVPLSLGERVLFISVFVLITVYPVYWLRNNNLALAGFAIFGSMWYLGQLLYFCKRCRIPSCPFNRAGKVQQHLPPDLFPPLTRR